MILSYIRIIYKATPYEQCSLNSRQIENRNKKQKTLTFLISRLLSRKTSLQRGRLRQQSKIGQNQLEKQNPTGFKDLIRRLR